MSVAEITTKRDKAADNLDRDAPSGPPQSRTATGRRMEIRPFLITLVAVVLAGLLGWATWGGYMGAPWTRDATVRADVVTIAPEVAGRIVELPVVDNKYVHKGDLLLVIDPTNFRIAVSHIRGSGAAGTGERARHRRSNGRPAGTDQCKRAHNYGWGAPRWYLRSNRPNATKNWRRTVMAPFRMPSSSHPSYVNRKRRCSLHRKASIRRCGRSRR